MSKRIEIVQDANAVVEKPVLAQAIVDLAKSVERLSALKLTRKAIIVLLAHDTGLGQRTIEDVLYGIASLRARYTTL